MNASSDAYPSAPVLVAHRGYSAFAPENTCAAFTLAVAKGAEWIECDIRSTADGDCVIIHDNSLARTTDGLGRVDRLPLQAVRRFSAGAWFAPAFHEEKVPILSELFACVPHRVSLDLEIKPGRLRGEALSSFVTRISHSIREHGRMENAVCTSFSWDTLEAMRAVDSGIGLGFLHHGRIRASALVKALQRVGARWYFQNVLTMSRALTEELQQAGIRVGVYTANSRRAFAAAVKCGVDYVITNEVEMGREYLRGLLEEASLP